MEIITFLVVSSLIVSVLAYLMPFGGAIELTLKVMTGCVAVWGWWVVLTMVNAS